MPDEAEVKALAEKLGGIWINYDTPPKMGYDTIGPWKSGKGYLSKESAEALTRVALEHKTKREAELEEALDYMFSQHGDNWALSANKLAAETLGYRLKDKGPNPERPERPDFPWVKESQ